MREREGTGAASPEDVPALIERGNALVRQGQAAAAIGRYAHALALQPECFEAHANLGSLLLALHRFAEAEIHLRRALAARPDQVPERCKLVDLGDWASERYRVPAQDERPDDESGDKPTG